jgi:hypothetical protein
MTRQYKTKPFNQSLGALTREPVGTQMAVICEDSARMNAVQSQVGVYNHRYNCKLTTKAVRGLTDDEQIYRFVVITVEESAATEEDSDEGN